MYRHSGVDILDCQIGGFQQPCVVLHRTVPGLARMAVHPHVRFVPDDPMVDAALVLLSHASREGFPVEHVGNGAARPVAGPIGRDRPLRCADQQADDLPPGSQFPFDNRIGHVGGFPVRRSGRLDHVPAQDNARVAYPGLACGRGIDEALDDAESRVRRGSLGQSRDGSEIGKYHRNADAKHMSPGQDCARAGAPLP